MSEGDMVLGPLIAATARGDAAGFRRLYDLSSSKLFGVVLRILRDRALAEEVLQESFVKIWRNASTFDARQARPMTWMASIARNSAIDAVRRRKTQPQAVAPLDDEDDPLAQVPDPASAGLDFGDREALRGCLRQLDEAQRRCILLAYCDGYSREELAERFDRPVGTIKTWLHRGLASLKTCLEGP